MILNKIQNHLFRWDSKSFISIKLPYFFLLDLNIIYLNGIPIHIFK